MNNLTGVSKFLIVLVLTAFVFGICYYISGTEFGKKILPDSKGGSLFGSSSKDAIKVGVVTWGGYAGGQYFNRGFKPNDESLYKKNYGFDVEFKVIDDFNASREAFKNGEIDLLWSTIDAFSTETDAGGTMIATNPKVVFQADKSRGGDAIVVRRGINSAADLKGKKIAVAEMTPSHTFLIWLLDANNLKMSDIELIKVANAIDAANMFKNQQVDAAVVWSPDDADCVAKVDGAKILSSTKQATDIIYDVFIAKQEFIDKNKDKLQKLYEGWMIGAAELNSSAEAKQKAAKILADGLNIDTASALKAINNTRLCTHGDNVKFFSSDNSIVNGEKLYSKMALVYSSLGYVKSPANWRQIAYSGLIEATKLTGTANEAEEAIKFTAATKEYETKQALSSKAVTITFPTASFTLSEDAKYIIDNQFVDLARSFGDVRIRIEGNTDNIGSPNMNKALSYKRAKAVIDYLVNVKGFNENRFIKPIGNGSDKPIADNSTEDGRAKNRRTDFQLVEN